MLSDTYQRIQRLKIPELEQQTKQWEEKKRKEIHRKYFDGLGVTLGYKNMEDWYNVTPEDISKAGGQGIISTFYNNSPGKALHILYPEHKWQLWKFSKVPLDYWKDTANQTSFFEWL